MGKKPLLIRTLIAIVIGSALMFVLMRFGSILPAIAPRTYINPGIAIVTIFAAVFGPLAGLLIGFIGHFLNDLTAAWNLSWIWIITDALYGFAIGLFWKLYELEDGKFGIRQAFIFNGIQIIANLLAWVAIAPSLDIIFTRERSDNAYLQGLVAAGLNILVVLILGTLLAVGYSKIRYKAKAESQEKE